MAVVFYVSARHADSKMRHRHPCQSNFECQIVNRRQSRQLYFEVGRPGPFLRPHPPILFPRRFPPDRGEESERACIEGESHHHGPGGVPRRVGLKKMSYRGSRTATDIHLNSCRSSTRLAEYRAYRFSSFPWVEQYSLSSSKLTPRSSSALIASRTVRPVLPACWAYFAQVELSKVR